MDLRATDMTAPSPPIHARRVVERAPAKINLALHVRRRRPDGYHDIETLFAFMRDGDTVTIEPAVADRFTLTGPFGEGLAAEGDNLVLRAASAFAGRFGALPPLSITLDKHLPIASGIGGGSADAAATLRALAVLRGVSLDDPALFELADALGADVPACLYGRSALGEGKGERLRPVEGLSGVPVLLVNPGVAVSTAAVFRGWDGVDRGPIVAGDPIEAALAGRNDLEAPARAVAPVISDLVETLAGLPGVRLARMSGSGATCFALFGDEAARSEGAARMASAHPGWWQLQSCLA